MKWLGKIDNLAKSSNNILSALSSLVTIISFPLIIIGLIVGYYQVKDIFTVPDVSLYFVHPSSVAYKIVNNSDKIAEDVLVSFGLFDLDSSPQNLVPIPSINYDYVNKRSANGPFTLLGNFGIKDHRYFGIIYIGCKGGKKLRTYWLYAKHGKGEDSFFAERKPDDTFQINVSQLIANTERYLDNLIPKSRRKYISE